MSQLQLQVHELQDGDLVVPSMRRVSEVTIAPDTPNGHRVVVLENAEGKPETFTFQADKLVTVQRN